MLVDPQPFAVGDLRPAIHAQRDVTDLGLGRRNRVQYAEEGHRHRDVQLPSATARVLDWYHIDMRFENLVMSLPGLRGTDVYSKNRLRERVIKAKWCYGTVSRRDAWKDWSRCDATQVGLALAIH